MPSFALRNGFTGIVGALIALILGVTAFVKMPLSGFPNPKIPAVVVLETINRHLTKGKEPAVAAKEGAAGVALPVLASTITTTIVFFRVMFLFGVAKDLFGALVLAFVLAMLTSYVVAMTVIRTYCARFLVQEEARALEDAVAAMQRSFSSFGFGLATVGNVESNPRLPDDFASQRCCEGHALRPATVAGLIPVAREIGTGSEAFAPLARAAGDALTVSIIFTLLLVPCVYELFYFGRAIQ